MLAVDGVPLTMNRYAERQWVKTTNRATARIVEERDGIGRRAGRA